MRLKSYLLKRFAALTVGKFIVSHFPIYFELAVPPGLLSYASGSPNLRAEIPMPNLETQCAIVADIEAE